VVGHRDASLKDQRVLLLRSSWVNWISDIVLAEAKRWPALASLLSTASREVEGIFIRIYICGRYLAIWRDSHRRTFNGLLFDLFKDLSPNLLFILVILLSETITAPCSLDHPSGLRKNQEDD